MRQLFNDGWQFLLSKPDSRPEDIASLGREEICLPHDWAIGDVADFYRDADGWYFKTFDSSLIPPEHDQVFLRFARLEFLFLFVRQIVEKFLHCHVCFPPFFYGLYIQSGSHVSSKDSLLPLDQQTDQVAAGGT